MPNKTIQDAAAAMALAHARGVVPLQYALTVIVHDAQAASLATTAHQPSEFRQLEGLLTLYANELEKREGERVQSGVMSKPYIKCLKCGTRSFHPQDIEHCYCAKCSKWHGQLDEFELGRTTLEPMERPDDDSVGDRKPEDE
jgi:hypothetical protein